ncbi:stomatal closure-related actin-binding protein 1 [Prunus yedoensis var. nudiflora]|uniref:Stomatal closure-related actin-binding protein 1 n=1 Tax=Prunus yedoensis var. nudiflora TaxID=2094558 RepID=A0A314YK83_PRUYE|nr:stomatal closure-related actin-binding protein 1 [Prunus yedoensis var. nudiflora]
MTRVGRDFGDTMQKDAVPAVSADVIFSSSRFPNYKIGANNQIVEAKDEQKVLSMKEVVARETAQLLEQQKRLSVRDLASKFEKGLAAAAKLSEEARLREAASLEKHVLLKKLRDALESLKGRVAGRNKDDVEDAISMVEALAVQLTQREGELMQEKAEVKKLANFLKQASEDAKKLVDEERAFARAEIENARAAVQRVEEALQEQEQMSRASGKQDLEELMKEVQEARRIKMLHQPSKVMDMEHELRALRAQLTEKSKNSVRLQKELAMSKRGLEQNSQLYELDGPEALGSYLRIQPCSDDAPELSKCSIQWYRVSSQGGKKELISGAIKSVYAPEPFDVGRILQADISLEGQWLTLTTAGPIDPAAGLGSYVEALVRKHDIEFNVVITQMNGVNHPSESIHVFHVGKMRIKLCKGKTTIAKEYFSTSMQLCGVRGGGNAAAQALFWQAKQGLSFVLAFESERERNAAIMLARRFAFDCNIMLAGPDDRAPIETNGAP